MVKEMQDREQVLQHAAAQISIERDERQTDGDCADASPLL
jgi:hypothetical protein